MLIAICVILTIINVVITIGGAGSGAYISSLQKKEQQLGDQKRTLQDDLVKSLSLSDLQEKSQSLGFIKPTDLVYLSGAAPVAKLP